MYSNRIIRSTLIRRLVLVFMSAFDMITVAVSQYYPNEPLVDGGVYSLDVPVDARSTAMGESFTALKNNSAATMYNPAGLAGLKGISFQYGQRALRDEINLSSLRYRSFVMTFCVSSFNVGISYLRYDPSSYDFTFAVDSSLQRTHIKTHDETLTVAIANSLADRLAVGLAFKVFDAARTADAAWYTPLSTSPAFLFDFGFIYSHPGFLSNALLDDSFSIGASLQNIGTDFRGKDVIGRVNEGVIRLPRYSRLGISYVISVPDPTDGLTTFSALFTAEYRNLLNAGSTEDNRDFWGFGVETTFLELLSARLGGFVQPFKSVTGDRGIPAIRYGLGMNLPLSRFGIAVPLGVGIEYAGFPVQNYTEYFHQAYTTWNVELSYRPRN